MLTQASVFSLKSPSEVQQLGYDDECWENEKLKFTDTPEPCVSIHNRSQGTNGKKVLPAIHSC